MRVRHLMVVIASLGGLLFGYETGVTAGALERGESSWLSTATLIGAMIGALAAGRIADLVGRRDVIMATGALFTLGAFVSASPSRGRLDVRLPPQRVLRRLLLRAAGRGVRARRP